MSNSRRASSIAPEYPLLGLLIKRPSHGYALHAQLRSELSEIWDISLSQTYNILKRLEAQGLIEGHDQQQPAGPDRYQLQPTAKGKEHFKQWLRTPSSVSSQALRVEFLSRLYFARRQGLELTAQLIAEQAVDIDAGIQRLERRRQELSSTSETNQWGLELRIHQLHAFQDWLRETRNRIITNEERSKAQP